MFKQSPYQSAWVKKGSYFSGVENLKEIGIVAPQFLNRLKRVRNTLEHDFNSPEKAFAENAATL